MSESQPTDKSSAPSITHPRQRQLLLLCVSVILGYVVLEFLCGILIGILAGNGWMPDMRQMHRRRLDIGLRNQEFSELQLNENVMKYKERRLVVHPFVGFVYAQPTEDGSWDRALTLPKREDGTLIVGIFGGSVAAQFARLGTPRLEKELNKLSSAKLKRVIFMPLGTGGYKQPQQLMLLNYLLALGAEFDAVINLDGFNEVALHEHENEPYGVYPAFPRSWYFLVNLLTATRERSQLDSFSRRRLELADSYEQLPWRFSPLWNVVWHIRDNALGREMNKLEVYVRAVAGESNSDTGPLSPQDIASEDALYSRLAEIWKNSSLQMHRLCDANGIHYYHFLQPNQYVADTKRLTDRERAVAYNENHPYKPGAEKGYPLLIREGNELSGAGVTFTDLTQLFVENDGEIYTDDCCHMNQQAYELIAQEIARVMTSDIQHNPPQSQQDVE